LRCAPGCGLRQLYDRVVEEEREEGNLWSKIKRRAEAVSRVCMATGAAMAAAGKAASSVSDKAVNQLASSVEKLRADVEDMDEVLGAHDKQAMAHAGRLAALEEEAKKHQVRILSRAAACCCPMPNDRMHRSHTCCYSCSTSHGRSMW
jgi:hypothetical protein